MNSKLGPLDRPVDRAAHHFDRAVRLLKDGNNSGLELERAVKEINRARALHENLGSHNIALAEAYRRALDCSSAIFALRYALETNPDDVATKKGLCDLLVNRAQETMVQGKHFDRASNYFEDALSMDPSRDKIWILKAVCEVRCKRFESALQCVDRAINMASDPPVDMYVMRAKIYWAMGMRDAGNTEMRKAAVMDKEHPEVQAFIIRAFGEAEKTYEEGLISFQGGDYDKAILLVNKALFVNRNDVKLHILLSKCYRAKNDLDTAYKSLTQAVDIFKSVDPYGMYTNVKIPFEINRQKNLIINEMALKYAVEGDFQKAILLMNKAIASERKMHHDNEMDISYMFFLNRGDCYRAIEEPLFAIADYKMAMERRPGDWNIMTKLSVTYYNLAVEYFNDAKYADCKIQMEGAVGLNNKIGEYFSLKGKAEYYLGQYDEAYSDFKRALELNPNDKDLKLRLVQFEKENGWDDCEELSTTHQAEVSESIPHSRSRKSNPPVKVKVQPSAINITTDPLGLCDDFSKIATREDLDTPLELSYCTSLLPTLNPYMAAPMLASELAKKKQRRVKEVTHSRTSMERGTLWKVVENISAQAEKQRQPLPKNVPEHKKSKPQRKPASSAVALKRLSEEISREAAKRPLLQGIKSCRDDPMLTALQDKLKAKTSILSQESLIHGDPVLMKSMSLPRLRVVSRSRGNDLGARNDRGPPSTKDDRITTHSR